jgi:excisionase family DNA binding protein
VKTHATTPLAPLLDTEDVARHLGISARQVRTMKARHELPYVTVGRLVRYRLQDLAAWENANLCGV